jgi:hypothetical protein
MTAQPCIIVICRMSWCREVAGEPIGRVFAQPSPDDLQVVLTEGGLLHGSGDAGRLGRGVRRRGSFPDRYPDGYPDHLLALPLAVWAEAWASCRCRSRRAVGLRIPLTQRRVRFDRLHPRRGIGAFHPEFIAEIVW